MHHIEMISWLEGFLRLRTADALEMYLCAWVGFIVLGPFAAMTYYHLVPEAVRRLPFLQWTVLILVIAAWLLSTSEAFSTAAGRLLPLTRPERARIIWTMAFVTFLLFAQLRLLGVPHPESGPEFRRRTRVVIR